MMAENCPQGQKTGDNNNNKRGGWQKHWEVKKTTQSVMFLLNQWGETAGSNATEINDGKSINK